MQFTTQLLYCLVCHCKFCRRHWLFLLWFCFYVIMLFYVYWL